jgi:hypothetical protein
MAELADWRALNLDEQDAEIIESFFALRPQWVPLSDPNKLRLATFEPAVDGVEALKVDLEECSLYWGYWYQHYIGWAGTVQDAVETIDAILTERAVRIVNRTKNWRITRCRPWPTRRR